MKSLIEQMGFYHDYHTKGITKMTHFLGIPMIIIALVLMFGSLSMTFTWIFIGILLCYYLLLDVSLGLLAMLFFIPLTLCVQWLLVNVSFVYLLLCAITFFILGWILQLLGHYHEGNKPAFLNNFFQIFIAPLFLIAEACFALGFKKHLQQQLRRSNVH